MASGDANLESVLEFIRENRGFDFTGYRRPSLQRRIAKRMEAVGIEAYDDYLVHLETHPDEFVGLFDTILINVTSFFRDPEAWEYVATEVVPQIVERARTEEIRVWVPGCASGEEAYTAAIVLCEALGEDAFRAQAKIYATDVDEGALGQGRHARYVAKDLEGVPADLREPYFEPSEGSRSFRADLRRNVIFRSPRPDPGSADLPDRPADRAQHAHVLHPRDAEPDPRAAALRDARLGVPLPRQVRGAAHALDLVRPRGAAPPRLRQVVAAGARRAAVRPVGERRPARRAAEPARREGGAAGVVRDGAGGAVRGRPRGVT